MNHKEYSTELIQIQDTEGKRIATAFISAVGKLVDGSDGDLNKLVKLLEVSKKQVMKQAVRVVRPAVSRAAKLGRDFGNDKV